MNATRGVEVMVRVLERLAAGPEVKVAELAETEDIARSSLFDIVRRLESAGLLDRRAGGWLAPGPQAVALAFARAGLPGLQGPAEALLRLLRDETGGTATLVAGKIELLHVSSGRPESQSEPVTFAAAIGGTAILRLVLGHGVTRAGRAETEALFQQVVLTLESRLEDVT